MTKTCSVHKDYSFKCPDCTKRKFKVYLGIPSTGDRADIQLYLFRDLQERYGDKIELVFPAQCTHRMFHDYARNVIAEEFLESDCDVLWYLDSDICPPKHILDLVVCHFDQWEAAGGIYPIWMVPPGYTSPAVLLTAYNGIVKNGNATTGIRVDDVPKSGQAFVDALATGCLFLKRSVFEKLEKPYFEFKYDSKDRKMIEGEDLGFALKLNNLGIRFFTDYSMVCKHYKRVCLLDVNNFATDASNGKVLAYDKAIRAQVEVAVQNAMAQAYQMGLNDAKAGQKGRAFKVNTEQPSGLVLPPGY